MGGSDNHRPLQPLDKQGSIGRPTTVVYAENLSTPAILAGIRAGHVCIDLAGTTESVLELSANNGTRTAQMGDMLAAASGIRVAFVAKVSGATQSKIVLLEDGKPLEMDATKTEGQDQTAHGSWTSDGQRHWFRAEAVGADQKLLLLGNPIYLNWENAH